MTLENLMIVSGTTPSTKMMHLSREKGSGSPLIKLEFLAMTFFKILIGHLMLVEAIGARINVRSSWSQPWAGFESRFSWFQTQQNCVPSSQSLSALRPWFNFKFGQQSCYFDQIWITILECSRSIQGVLSYICVSLWTILETSHRFSHFAHEN